MKLAKTPGDDMNPVIFYCTYTHWWFPLLVYVSNVIWVGRGHSHKMWRLASGDLKSERHCRLLMRAVGPTAWGHDGADCEWEQNTSTSLFHSTQHAAVVWCLYPLQWNVMIFNTGTRHRFCFRLVLCWLYLFYYNAMIGFKKKKKEKPNAALSNFQYTLSDLSLLSHAESNISSL